MKNLRQIRTYANLLFEQANSTGKLDKISDDFGNLVSTLKSSKKIERYFTASIYSINDKRSLLDEVLGSMKLDKSLSNFIDILLENNRMGYLEDIYYYFSKRLNESKGQISAKLFTAKKISDKDLKFCISIFEKKIGKKLIVTHEIDSSIIGGAILTWGSNMLDLSVLNVQNQLSREINEI